MNKQKVDKLIPLAYEKIKTVEIANQAGEVTSSFRGQISAFGAALATGSLLSAIAFFSLQGDSKVHRPKLLQVIWLLIESGAVPASKAEDDAKCLFDKAVACSGDREGTRRLKAQIIDAAIAVKLSLNLYTLVKREE
jgi:hypothetical protein